MVGDIPPGVHWDDVRGFHYPDKDGEPVTPSKGPEAIALANLKEEAEIIGRLYPSATYELRLARLEALVDVLVRALQIKGALELEEVRRQLAEITAPGGVQNAEAEPGVTRDDSAEGATGNG